MARLASEIVEGVAFEIIGRVSDFGRSRWTYQIGTVDGALIARGSDLSTPEYTDPDDALTSLLGFAAAAADPHSGAGALFTYSATQALREIADELALAVFYREEEFGWYDNTL